MFKHLFSIVKSKINNKVIWQLYIRNYTTNWNPDVSHFFSIVTTQICNNIIIIYIIIIYLM